MDSSLPADLFTSCILTPIQTSVFWYILKNHLEVFFIHWCHEPHSVKFCKALFNAFNNASMLQDRFPVSIIDRIPGQLNDRRTMLGELNWIFTAITDTIAWSSLPKDLFQKLFRLVRFRFSLFIDSFHSNFRMFLCRPFRLF